MVIMENCIFCSIIRKEIPSVIVLENEKVIAVRDIKPAAPVHVLIIPKAHIKSLDSIGGENLEIMKDVVLAIQEIAKKEGIQQNGYRVISNIGKDGGQTIDHLHFHLLGGKNLGMGLLNE
jgi:histidine triad (HIT) family protein